MALNDSLSDMLARIKNAHQANKISTLCLKSKLNMNVLSVLKDEGYIRDFKNIEERKGVNSIKYASRFINYLSDLETKLKKKKFTLPIFIDINYLRKKIIWKIDHFFFSNLF